MYCRYGLIIYLLVLTACANLNSPEQTEPSAVSGLRQATAYGHAEITDAGVERARQAAVDDAIVNISMQLKQNVGEPLHGSDIKIVDEWQDNGVYHVQALAILTEKRLACQSDHRKKLLATAFPAMNTEQISGADSQDLYNGIPREIGNQLMENGDFIVRNLTNTVLYDDPERAPEIARPNYSADPILLTLAKRYDAQFVLSGVIRDLKTESTEYVRGSGALALLKSTMRDYVARRSVGIDVYVYDGFTGALLFQQRYTDSIVGDVSLPPGYTVGSERFEDSPAGHKISQIIRMAGEDIQDSLACYPFAARITRVENGRIIISAGAQDKVRVGDKLMVYSAGHPSGSGLGFTDPIGIMVVHDVGPTMAAGQLEGDAHTIIRPGDWIRRFSAR
ncbi:MAG: flagella assembly protein FlgT middle domain-containing protein [Gammaproteobacteria bacterium]